MRLLVPTATMAQHLRHAMAREGFVFRPELIQTLHRFIEPWAADLPEAGDALFHLLVEQATRTLGHPDFAKVAHLPGFHAKLAAALDECASAGCDSATLARLLPPAPIRDAIIAAFAEVERLLAQRKIGLRATRLKLAASAIERHGTGPIKSIWLDGFFSLTDPELAVVEALTKRAEITVTLPAADVTRPARERLLRMGFEEHVLSHERQAARRELVVSPSIEREADEIARRILEAHAGGRLFREIGIIVRRPEIYVSILRATLERFGIPTRFYFDRVLTEQPAVRYLAGAVDAMLGGWDHAEILVAMKLAPGVGSSTVMDRFDFAVRKRMPGTGLARLKEIASQTGAGDDRVRRLLDRLSELDGWRGLAAEPARWAEQFARLRALYRPSRPRDGVDHETALAWRSQTEALDLFDGAVEQAAESFDRGRKIPLDEFWQTVKAVLRLTPLRVPDQRRDVVHVLSGYEARQWELPVVFVCGLVEGQFPFYRAPDPFLPESARRELNRAGVRVRTANDHEMEERFLYDSAITRATASLTVSYPKNDARGELNLPSLYLDAVDQPVPSRAVRPQNAAIGTAPRNGLCSADLLAVLQQKHAVMRPTALESYVQCPFQFFGRHTLDLESAPVRPEERFDFMVRGTIVHKVIAEWLTTRGSVREIFDRIFREQAASLALPAGYKTEMLRAQLLADLERFAATDRWPDHFESQVEENCEFALASGLGIRGRIDRLLKTPDGRGFVIDYKYSRTAKDKASNENLLQGPLYWLAIERAFHLQPTGMYYCSLRDKVEYAGWGETPSWVRKPSIQPFTPEWLETALVRSARAASEIAAGRTEPAPADVSRCRLCDYRDVCRYEVAASAVIAEGA
ncbi:MAG TPA: PD-(D/E)XK nuclease family protein [Bryobacteraceae bacterium]|nr:PD-(D/E)XK nuclease family protein [Bryobacteraceae bacterium]